MIQTGIQVLNVGIKMRDWVMRSRIKAWHQAWHPEIQTYLVLLCFKHSVILNKLNVSANPLSCKSICTIFHTIFVPSLSLCHILVILAIFQTFSLLSYFDGNQWSMFFNFTTQWRFRWWLAFKYLKIKVYILLFRHNSIIQLVDYSIE